VPKKNKKLFKSAIVYNKRREVTGEGGSPQESGEVEAINPVIPPIYFYYTS
jgi:hypothetical protein